MKTSKLTFFAAQIKSEHPQTFLQSQPVPIMKNMRTRLPRPPNRSCKRNAVETETQKSYNILTWLRLQVSPSLLHRTRKHTNTLARAPRRHSWFPSKKKEEEEMKKERGEWGEEKRRGGGKKKTPQLHVQPRRCSRLALLNYPLPWR